jgi:23S rRNA (adenine2503-C2)-methyltransferase
VKKDLKELSGAELEALLGEFGQPRWRAEEIRRWIYSKGAPDFDSMTSLPLALRERLAGEFVLFAPAVSGRERAGDGTVKLCLSLQDEAPCETVLIAGEGRFTQCLSSQSGCPLGCTFCQTGRLGLRRSLTASEIADQWLTARRELGEEERITNLVYMGMGESLLNYDALRESVEIFTAPWGADISPRRITVSTAGIVPGIDRMGKEMPPVNLAVSLNAPEDDLRDRLMPVNRKYPLADLIASLQRYPAGRKPLTIEYVLLGGTNDSPAMARKLAKLLRGLRCKVNLIPFNPHSGLPFSPPEERAIQRFQDILKRSGYTAPVRRSKGAEVAAACGQLGTDQR